MYRLPFINMQSLFFLLFFNLNIYEYSKELSQSDVFFEFPKNMFCCPVSRIICRNGLKAEQVNFHSSHMESLTMFLELLFEDFTFFLSVHSIIQVNVNTKPY